MIEFHHATKDNSPFVAGRRAFLQFRDLGLSAATDGRMRAQIISAEQSLSQPTGWHYHTCEAQFLYMIEGWADLEFDGGTEMVRLEAGHAVLVPGGTPHNEPRTADKFRTLEISIPGDMGTVVCPPDEPVKLIRPGSSRTVSSAATARWIPSLAGGIAQGDRSRDLGMDAPSAGLLVAKISAAGNGTEVPGVWRHHTGEVQFQAVLEGWIEIDFPHGMVRAEAGDAIVIPGGMPHRTMAHSKKLCVFEMSLP